MRKILRSLADRFRAKITAIEKSNDSFKLDELAGSLQTFEMTIESPRKSKAIALNAVKEESLGSEGEGDEKFWMEKLLSLLENSRSTRSLKNTKTILRWIF